MALLAYALLAIAAGSGVFCILVIVAARSYLSKPVPAPSQFPPLSVLKPLAGADEGLQANLQSFFEQDYPGRFEILAAVRTESDPAAAVFRRVQTEFAHVRSRLLFVGDSPYANAKVWSLQQMTAGAEHDILVMSDSDVRVTKDMLQVIVAEFADKAVGVSTCPYRAVAGHSLWSKLEAVGMNTEFLAGVLVARLVEGMKFALGPTIAARKRVIADVGGWPYLAEFLAEDFVLGNLAAERGWSVLLSRYMIEHHIGSQPWQTNAKHRLRWFRSTRRSRPAGYAGQLFTNPLPIALLLFAVRPEWWSVVLIVTILRALAAVATAEWVLRDWNTLRRPWLIILQDMLSFAFWLGGFFGNTIVWRGRKYHLQPDGRFKLVG